MRGPTLAKSLRKLDSTYSNKNRQAGLRFPQIYLLDRGYRNFWKYLQFRDLCEPCGYTPMDSPYHKRELASYRQHRRSRSTSVRPARSVFDRARREPTEVIINRVKLVSIEEVQTPGFFDRKSKNAHHGDFAHSPNHAARTPWAETPRVRLHFGDEESAVSPFH
ncbi:unnamed protein product [Caenorhabditis auriculariae]|uniref:Uncharacterized protein n=1 Tax=Caenorhabditis auriculariae TaxID=2777116 RepID=A0A8S1HES7_9PELO|nr:unnamed protein product [Caenorhabditis auriculariae]